MKNSHLHALILGSSFLISLSIILVRISLARRDSDASTEPPPSAGVETSSPSSSSVPPGAETVQVSSAEEVENLLARAQELYKSSALAEGREAELEEAGRLLVQAGEILETLPADDAHARELKRQWSELRQDVSRASGF